MYYPENTNITMESLGTHQYEPIEISGEDMYYPEDTNITMESLGTHQYEPLEMSGEDMFYPEDTNITTEYIVLSGHVVTENPIRARSAQTKIRLRSDNSFISDKGLRLQYIITHRRLESTSSANNITTSQQALE